MGPKALMAGPTPQFSRGAYTCTFQIVTFMAWCLLIAAEAFHTYCKCLISTYTSQLDKVGQLSLATEPRSQSSGVG